MNERKGFESVLFELQGILGPEYARLIDPSKKVVGINKEFRQSSDFVSAGFDQEVGRENESDRSIFTLRFEDNSQLFVISGKVKSGNPYEIMYGGADLRETRTIAYSYDGIDNIVEFDLKSGESVTYTGDNGSPDTLLPWLQKTAGRLVKTETFT